MVSTKAGTRYKTDAEVEVKQLRRALVNVRKSLVELVGELDEMARRDRSAGALVVRQRVCDIQQYIDTLT